MWLISCMLHPTHFSATVHTHTHTQPFNGPWSGTTRLGRYEKKHSPTHTHPDHRTSFINFLHLLPSIASSVFSLRASQSSLTTSLQVLLVFLVVLDPLLHTPCIPSPSHFSATMHQIFLSTRHTLNFLYTSLHLVSQCAFLSPQKLLRGIMESPAYVCLSCLFVTTITK